MPANALACSLLLVALDPGTEGPTTEVLKEYRAAEVGSGKDPEAHVRLALWCESQGLTAEEARHLALAVLHDPANAAARGLLGLVAYGGRWQRPETVAEKVKADEALSNALAEYNDRRSRTPDNQDAQWKLALWCEQNGLSAEAQAHFTAVTRLPPPRRTTAAAAARSPLFGPVPVLHVVTDHREAAWKRLGCRRHNGRWMTEAQIADESAQARAQEQADRHWTPILERSRRRLEHRDLRDGVEQELARVTDPRAVPAVRATFGTGDAPDQARAVQLMAQIDAPSASRGLAGLALQGKSSEVRRAAAETLQRRDPREFAGSLIGLMHDPVKYQARPVAGPGKPGEILVEGEQYNLRFDYSPPPVQGGPRNRDEKYEEAMKAAYAAETQLLRDVVAIEDYNASVRATNPEIARVLVNATGQDLGVDRGAWEAWYVEQMGYRYIRPESKPTFTVRVPPAYQPKHYPSCFGAGTPVQTLTGPRPIESVRVGDRVLAQDIRTGELRYRPVLAVHHNPPAATLVIRLGADRIVSSTYHRFWVPGRGWVMARELKPGDTVRTLGGPSRVLAAEDGGVQPVYNLDVAGDRDFFAGDRGALVHDNTLPEPVGEPFDAPPVLADVSKPGR